MHELALAESILAVALDAAQGERIERIRVRVGTLQRVVPDSLQFSFQLLAEETPAFGGALEIRPVRAQLRCGVCGRRSVLKDALFRCRDCGSETVAIVTGDELIVDAVETETGWRYRPKPAPVAVSLDHLREHAFYEPVLSSGEWPWPDTG